MKLVAGICGFLTLLLVFANSWAASAKGNGEGQTISSSQIHIMLEDYIQGQVPPGQELTLRFKYLQLPESVSVPAGKVDTEIMASDSDILKNRSFNIQIRVDGKTVENLTVRGEVEASGTVPVAVNGLKQGKIITLEDLVMQEVDLTNVNAPIYNLDELLGKRVRRSIRAGLPIEETYVDDPPLVKRGEIVTLMVRRGALELTAQGLARKDGILGEVITVRNTNSRKDILCRVAGPGLVQVEF